MKPSVTLGRYGIFRRKFILTEKLLKTHKHIMGITGQGKSKLLAHMASSLILQGVGCCLLDPHADLAEDVLQILADNKYFDKHKEELLYIDFHSTNRYIPFNFLNQPNYDRYTIARNMVEICQRVWPSLADGAAATFENVMYFATLVLVQNNLPLTSLTRVIADKHFRDSLLLNCPDPMIHSFWKDQYEQWIKKDTTIAASSLRRANILTVAPPLRFSIGQEENVLPFRKLLDKNISVIVNLGGLDETTQRILGALICKGVEQAAESREDIPEHERTLYCLIMDEFSMFSAQSEEALTRVLSLCRKYNLFLTLAHQNFSQLSERIQGALQNAMPIFFRLGYQDALWAAPRIGRANPRHVKHEPKALKGELTIEQNPVYYQMQEEYEEWLRKIEGLYPQQAYIKYDRQIPKFLRRFFHNTKTIKVKTVTLPSPKVKPHEIMKIKDYYAQTLMKTVKSELVTPIKRERRV